MYHGSTPIWRFHTKLCKFLRNISTNICGLGKRTGLKLGEVSSLFISNKIPISWLYPLNGFRFIFLLRDSENDLYVISVIHCMANAIDVQHLKHNTDVFSWRDENHCKCLRELESDSVKTWIAVSWSTQPNNWDFECCFDHKSWWSTQRNNGFTMNSLPMPDHRSQYICWLFKGTQRPNVLKFVRMASKGFADGL